MLYFIREYLDVTCVETDKIVAIKLHEEFRSTHHERGGGSKNMIS